MCRDGIDLAFYSQHKIFNIASTDGGICLTQWYLLRSPPREKLIADIPYWSLVLPLTLLSALLILWKARPKQ